MKRYVGIVGSLAVVFSVAGTGVGPAAEQTHVRQPSGPRLARLDKSPAVIEGKLTRVDGRRETVDVSIGLLGLLGKTLEINRDTLIQVDGREAKFADLQEGAKVKAFYQERGAKLVATRLVVSSS